MRIKFTGPEGAKYAGHELVGIIDTQRARNDAISDAEFATGWKLKEIGERTKQSEGLTAHLSLFMTLRGGGFWVTWDEVGALTGDDYENISEPSDPVDPGAEDTAAEDDAADPTSARTASVPGADAPAAPAAKRTRTGSKSRSARDS